MRITTVLLLGLCFGATAAGGEWPQVLGPNRNGHAREERLAEQWPESGPEVLWEREVGSGFAGVAVADGVAVLFHRVGAAERVEGLDAKTGRVLWTSDARATYQPSFTNDNGPRAVPLIHGDKVYVYGAMGVLRCLTLKDGQTVWQRDTFDEFNSKRTIRGEPPEGYFGIGSTPVVADGKLLVNVGGDTQNAGVVAFALTDGSVAWKSTVTRASYSAPIVTTVDGQTQAIFATRFEVVALDPQGGQVLWQFPFGEPGPNVTAATPLVINGHLLVSASYGFGAVWAKLGKSSAQVLWKRDDLLSSQYTTGIAVDRHIIGIDGRQDIGVASLRCIDPFAAKVVWEQPQFGYASLLAADGKLLILKTDGELVLARLDTRSYREIDRAQILDGTTRALPALAGGLLYVRDADRLKCVDLRPVK